jgi:hypothetical protein
LVEAARYSTPRRYCLVYDGFGAGAIHGRQVRNLAKRRTDKSSDITAIPEENDLVRWMNSLLVFV